MSQDEENGFNAEASRVAVWLFKMVAEFSRVIRGYAFLLLVGLLIGCGRSETSSTDMSDFIVSVQSDDSEMVAAMQNARDHFPEFWTVISADHKRVIPLFASAMVKAYFSDDDAPEGGEHMWVGSIDYDGKMISGVLMDTPGHVRSVRMGQSVSFPIERLSDWLFIRDGKAVGVFTVQLLRTRMTSEQREAHDSQYSFRFE